MTCRCCGQGPAILPVSNPEIDSLMCGSPGDSAWWWIPDARKAALVRGRAYYSARIHGAEIATSYKDGYLKVRVNG